MNLNLESAGGGLRPVNPLVGVSIPGELGEGIELPGPGIGIELVGVAQERGASKLNGSAAFYPNVEKETDVAVAPTPAGVETLTQLRDPESPRTQTYRITMPEGASLLKKGGGAEVDKGEEVLLTIAPPSALGADGNNVPAELSVQGDELTVSVSPDFRDQLPGPRRPAF